MAPGDAQRVWFPEMLDDLKAYWSSSVTWEELSLFCQRMMEKRKQIRESRGIKPPLFRCHRCGEASRSEIKGISIRSALFALKKIGVVNEMELSTLDTEWKIYKKRNSLDNYGKKKLEE